jgi:hypothetical protein
VAKISAQKITFPVSHWVHAIILTCANQLAVWYKDHHGLPSVCCLYPHVDGPSYYDSMIGWPGPGRFVWHVLPYHQPYTIVQPPTPPYGACPDGFCHLFLNGSQNLTANVANLLTFGSIDFGCTNWNLNFPTTNLPAVAPSPLSLTLGVTIENPFPPTVDIGYSLDNGAITFQTLTLVANLDGSGTATGGWNNVQTATSDTIQFYVRPPSGCTLRGNNSGVTTLADMVSDA